LQPTDIYDVVCPYLDIYKDLLCFFQNTTADILVEYENLFCVPRPIYPHHSFLHLTCIFTYSYQPEECCDPQSHLPSNISSKGWKLR